MSLGIGLNIAKSALALVSTQTAITSRNLAGANEENYVQRGVATINIPGAGVYADHVTRSSNPALLRTLMESSSSASAKQAMLEGLNALHQTVNDPELGNSISAKLSELEAALNLYSEAPGDLARANAVAQRASDLVNTLNGATQSVTNVRQQADADMAASVNRINGLLEDFGVANARIVDARKNGSDIADLLDQREGILKELSDEIGIRTVQRSNSDIAIYTESGVTLYDRSPRQVTFNPTIAFSATTTGNAVFVDGVDVTSSSAALPISGGRLAGLAELRDGATVAYQSQLDEVARGLIETFAEIDPGTPPTLPPQTGLFSYAGGPGLPATGTHVAGLASQIVVNPAVNPAAGGSASLIRDGGINGPGYVENPTGGAGFDGRINRFLSAISETRSFDSYTGLGAAASVSAYATSSAAWLEQLRSDTSNEADLRETLKIHSSLALSNATGVNVDEEMATLLELERSYEASARLISVIDEMFTTLLSAAA